MVPFLDYYFVSFNNCHVKKITLVSDLGGLVKMPWCLLIVTPSLRSRLETRQFLNSSKLKDNNQLEKLIDFLKYQINLDEF